MLCNWLISLSILSSRFAHGAACVRIPALCQAAQNSMARVHPHFASPFICQWTVWVVSTFWPLWILLLWTRAQVTLYDLVSVLLAVYSGVVSLDPMVVLFLTFPGTALLFPVVAHHSPFSSTAQCSSFSTSSPTLAVSFWNSSEVIWVMVLICQSQS